MATPRRPAAVPSTTSMASIMAVRKFDLKKRKDADHVWVPDKSREQVIHLGGEPHLLTPLVKRYTDPYGLLAYKPDSGACRHCKFLNVRQSSWERLKLTNMLSLTNNYCFPRSVPTVECAKRRSSTGKTLEKAIRPEWTVRNELIERESDAVLVIVHPPTHPYNITMTNSKKKDLTATKVKIERHAGTFEHVCTTSNKAKSINLNLSLKQI